MRDINNEDLIKRELSSRDPEAYYSRTGIIGQYFMDYVDTRGYITLTNHANGSLMLKKDVETVIEGLKNYLEAEFTDEDIKKHNEKVIKDHYEYLYGEGSRERVQKIKENIEDFGIVYFIKEHFSGTVKIGKTKNLKRREKQFGVKLPFEWDFIKVMDSKNYSLTESLLHKKYQNKRVNGEWFLLSDEEIEDIKSENFDEFILDSIYGSREILE